MTYKELVEINEQHKNNLEESLNNVEDRETYKKRNKYRLVYNRDRRWVAECKLDNSLYVKKFNTTKDILEFYVYNKNSYISNLSVIHNAKNSYVYNKYKLSDIEYDIIINKLRKHNIDKLIFKRVENIGNTLSRLVLNGGVILWRDNEKMLLSLVVVKIKNDIYVLSDCMIEIGVETRKEFSHGLLGKIHCKKLYIDNLDISHLDNLKLAFSLNYKVEEITLKNFDTSNVELMSCMFANCENLRKVNLEILDTKKVTSFDYMFCQCKSIRHLDLSSFDTSSLEDIDGMFQDCYNLETLDISTWNVYRLSSMLMTFERCTKIKEINGYEKLKNNTNINRQNVGFCYYAKEKGFNCY